VWRAPGGTVDDTGSTRTVGLAGAPGGGPGLPGQAGRAVEVLDAAALGL
jgi:hypothetical protein